MPVCYRCGNQLEYVRDWGLWIHVGGGARWQSCNDCKKHFCKERPLRACPFCGSLNIKDDHIATPKNGGNNG